MNLNQIIIVPKLSKFEYDLKRQNITEKELIKQYKKYKIDYNKIIKSHERQKASLNSLKEIFPEKQFILRDKISIDVLKKAKLVISLGGDNHFQYVSHFIDNQFILGVNSDPLTSDGYLTSMDAKKLIKNLKKIEKNNYKIKNWTRLKININGKDIETLATSELFIGELNREYMSRHILECNGLREEQKCAGLIISTGRGSTGWYSSASRYLLRINPIFSPTEKFFRFIVTEPYNGRILKYKLLNGTVKQKEFINIYSLNDTKGIISIDSLEDYDFTYGNRATISIGKPLKVTEI
ncbi:NAD(+)/NADH kinase [Candidatus Woesearchaeota archaeon]|nr:NAD(+)/NADH kinase [Candidatus Woesearchaeota archaeon]